MSLPQSQSRTTNNAHKRARVRARQKTKFSISRRNECKPLKKTLCACMCVCVCVRVWMLMACARKVAAPHGREMRAMRWDKGYGLCVHLRCGWVGGWVVWVDRVAYLDEERCSLDGRPQRKTLAKHDAHTPKLYI